MKYKLINSVSKTETICDKITIDGFDYYVSREIENTSGKIAYIDNATYKNELRIVTTTFGKDNLKDCKKVIATNNPDINIPKVVDEVEKLAKKYADEFEYNELSEHRLYVNVYQGFIQGYKKSQETHSNSDEDTIEFGNWLLNDEDRPPFTIESKKELLQLWKEQRPKTIYYE